MNPTQKRASLHDVACAAGVTHATVHNVLNNKGRFSDAVRDRVLAAVGELDYRSNRLASGLKTGRSQGIGVLVHRISSYLAARQLEGAEAAASRCGYHLIISAHDDDATRAIGHLEAMRDRQLDGVISLSTTTALPVAVTAQISALRLPFVYGLSTSTAPAEIEGAGADHVLADQRAGGEMIANHLLGLGRRRFAFLGVGTTHASNQRLAGVRAALEEHGLELRNEQVARAKEWTGDAGAHALREWLDSGHEMPDAIIAASDRLAAGAMRVLLERGTKVPDDVAVSGFDNMTMSQDLPSALTTVELPLRKIGAACVERLLQRLDEPEAHQPSTQFLPCQLIVRDSCGANQG